MSHTFVLQFDPSEISRLAAQYGPEQDEEAFRAGSSIAAGNYTRENLNVIVRWKSTRRAALIVDNTDAEIAKALRFAADVRTSEKLAVEISQQCCHSLEGQCAPMRRVFFS